MFKTYASLSKEFKPNKLVEKALSYIQDNGKALDVGAGALRDSKYLLEKGFTVVAVDKDPLIKEEAEKLQNQNLTVHVTDLAEWNFPENSFNLAIAINSLPFLPKSVSKDVFNKIKKSLIPGGVFCFSIFGDRDGWVANENMSFFSKEEIEDVVSDMKALSFEEEEKDGKTIRGADKHWHIFRVIVRK